MEEDIKILENKLKQWEPYKNIKFTTEIEKEIARENKAIENLINRNKELEEENRIFALAGSNIALKLHIEKNYIPKSKIKENIEEYKGQGYIEIAGALEMLLED